MTTVAACRTCGTAPLENPRFCHGCGSPVEDADTRAEYKQVTVLFADVVHSMDIAAAVGAERLREIMTDLADRCAAVVERYGGMVDKFTGDGIMAVFGAPAALEDHAIRACLAALGIQEETNRLAVDVQACDGVDLQVRVGLNSGEVIAGEIGSRSLGYTAVGEQVGMAQRMESVAPPGAVMLSASTARLVEGTATLAESELVQVKGADEPVLARRLLGLVEEHRAARRAESNLVGRRWEMSAAEGLLERAINGDGAVVGVVGPPGIGKSRLVRELAAIAHRRNVEVFTTFCESHATDVPFHVVARLLRAVTGVERLDAEAARAQVRANVRDANPEDFWLFDDLLGIIDPEIPLPRIDPDARRRRLTALVNAASLARKAPALYVIEDAHWIDEVSESMLAEFVTVIPQTPSLVLITYRPEYRGALSRVAGAHTVALAPLSDSETTTLVTELLGHDHSIGELGQKIAERAAGNPFFAEEIVRELAERGVLRGAPGAYISAADVDEVSVPATLQATIAARIDRLDPQAKRTLSAAAVIGSRFGPDLLDSLGIEAALDELVKAELIDQVGFTPRAEYGFRHPLIRTVAYESQLKSDRAQLHRGLAAAIEGREPQSADQNAALIAEHLEAAHDLHAAYGWHMRAATWVTNRDITAARLSWERARKIADALPAEDPNRVAMRIAPRTMLCISAWRGVPELVAGYFDELRELCALAGDKASLAMAMTGLSTELLWHGQAREASRLASDRWIDLAEGDPAKGANLAMGSPLAGALACRGVARYSLGRPGWREDLVDAVAMARSSDPVTHALVVALTYGLAIGAGVLRADDAAVGEIEQALRDAEGLSGDTALGSVKFILGAALTYRDAPADHRRGLELLEQVRDMWLRERSRLYLVPSTDVYIARERARRGDRDGALSSMRKAVDDLFQVGLLSSCFGAQVLLVEMLLERGAEGDVAEANSAIDRLATFLAEEGSLLRDIWLLRLRALLARAHGDDISYREYRDRYRDTAKTLEFEGHIAWAATMP
jgi:class 3 adenylate cyclase/energy-coupling factor transporter ATP-binding protein EcfA2